MIELSEREQEDGIIPLGGVSKSDVLQDARLFSQSGTRPSKKFHSLLFLYVTYHSS